MRRFVFHFGRGPSWTSVVSLLSAAALVCVGALACAGKSVRDRSEAGDNAGEGGTRTQSGGAGGNVARGGASGGPSGGTDSRGGASGTATGGASTGGTSGSGTCPECTPHTCATIAIPTTTINDFDHLDFPEGNDPPIGLFGILDEEGMLKPEWWLGYFSGSYVFPAVPQACSGEPAPQYALVQNETAGNLRVTGTVGGPSSFGIWFGPCIVDMSGWNGFSFTIGGRTGTGALVVSVHTSSNTDPDGCQIGRGKCTANVCAPPSVRLPIPDSAATIALPWSAFAGGSPSATVDPSELVLIRWDFEWADGFSPYLVDVTLDNVMLFE